MTEGEWNACDKPRAMLELSFDSIHGHHRRKCRLFMCAGCRHVWGDLKDKRSRRGVEIAERYAEGLCTREELEGAWDEADSADPSQSSRDRTAASLANDAAWPGLNGAISCFTATANGLGVPDRFSCDVLRDFFDPFSRLTCSPDWRTPLVLRLAEAAYAERLLPSGMLDKERLLILSDALADEGCPDGPLLAHLRREGPHWRGCAALDILLGKDGR